jgi:hypothetical protein
MLLRALVPLLAAAACCAVDSESELTFIDLRAHGGLVDTTGHGAALTIMCGDIGDKDQHVIDTWRDVGVVLGVRGLAEHVKAKLDVGGPTLQENILGLNAMGGIGAYIDAENLLEIVAGYGFGQSSDGTASGFHKNGSTKQLSLEIGWYHTMAKHYQLGALIGFSHDTLKLDSPTGGAVFRAKSQGLDLAVELGYRF